MNMKYGYSCLAVVKPNILLFLHRFNGFMGTSVSHIQVLIVVTMWYLKRITVLTTLQSHEHRNAGFTPEKCEGKHLCWKMVPHIKAPRRSWEQRCICFFFSLTSTSMRITSAIVCCTCRRGGGLCKRAGI